jgi:hypothetical protein
MPRHSSRKADGLQLPTRVAAARRGTLVRSEGGGVAGVRDSRRLYDAGLAYDGREVRIVFLAKRCETRDGGVF